MNYYATHVTCLVDEITQHRAYGRINNSHQINGSLSSENWCNLGVENIGSAMTFWPWLWVRILASPMLVPTTFLE